MIHSRLGRREEAMASRRMALERAQRHLALNPGDARAWYIGAISLMGLGERTTALEWIGRSLAIDSEDMNSLWNIACAYSVGGEPERALDLLERVFRKGRLNTAWLIHDSDFDLLRGHPRFQALLQGRVLAPEDQPPA
jgi:adenylate cyclase